MLAVPHLHAGEGGGGGVALEHLKDGQVAIALPRVVVARCQLRCMRPRLEPPASTMRRGGGAGDDETHTHALAPLAAPWLQQDSAASVQPAALALALPSQQQLRPFPFPQHHPTVAHQCTPASLIPSLTAGSKTYSMPPSDSSRASRIARGRQRCDSTWWAALSTRSACWMSRPEYQPRKKRPYSAWGRWRVGQTGMSGVGCCCSAAGQTHWRSRCCCPRA